jgi:cold shock CspA family protein
MKYFGTVKSFNSELGRGEITPETTNHMLGFDRSGFTWENEAVPTVGQRLSYDIGTNSERKPCALNLQTI